ncbi:MAG: GAF domain-containing protein [Anaerolineales bacterium]|nr:GAF domain-containing protein [Anaerolineales bacterium]
MLIASAVLLLLTIFVFYDIQAQRATQEETLTTKGKSMALTGAAAVEHIFADAIASGRLTEAQIFDTNYQPIANTTPQKYLTAYDNFTDANLLQIQDAFLQDTDVLFAVAVDINGYLPTHNTSYSQPLTNDYETDLVGNRTKRIFDDPVGIAAAKNTTPVLHQIYVRDTGERAWDFSAPIRVNGKHWGGFRVGFSLERVEAQISSLTWRIILAGVGLVMGLAPAIFLVIRQVIRPVQILAAAATQFGQGNLEVEIKLKSNDELGQLGHAFNHMAFQIKGLIDTLEERVAARTQRLEIAATLNERVNAILKLEDLLAEVVNRIKNSFDYYHTHIYLLDDKNENLVVAEGTGEAGAAMKAKGHHIRLNAPTSLVARAARTGEIVRVDNVREAKDWLPNPLLPDTYSEMAVPVILEGKVVGVLDVQQNRVAGLDDGDENLLRSLASHIAIAIRNARQFAEVEASLKEAREIQQRYVEQAWASTRVTHKNVGRVRFSLGESTTLSEGLIAEAQQQALHYKKPEVVALSNANDHHTLVAPISLRNVVIGDLQLHEIDPEREWTESEMALISAVIDQVAQAAETLRLLDETQERASREQLVSQISNKMRRAPDMDSLLKVAVTELSRALNPARTFVHMDLKASRGSGEVKTETSDGNGIEQMSEPEESRS